MATYHFANNQAPNAHPLAIQGNDAWNGLSPTFTGGSNGPKRDPANFNPGLLQAGDEVLFANGSYWSNGFNALIENPGSSSMARTNMIRFSSYDPGTGATGRPWFKSSSIGFMFGGFGGSGAPTHGGYLIEDIKLEGPVPEGFSFPGGDSFGIRINNPIRWIIVRNCEVFGYKAGIVASQAPGSASSYVLIEDCEIHHCGLAAIEGFANWFLVQNNNVHHCGELHPLTHGIYCGSSQVECTAGTFRHNYLHDNNIDGTGAQVGGQLTYRGKLRGTHADDNRIHNEGGRFNSNAGGIAHRPGYPSTDEYHLYSKIRRNDVSGAQSAISVSSVPGVLIQGNTVRDNGTVANSCPPVVGIGWPLSTLDIEDITRDTGGRVIGNRVISINPRDNTRPIWANGGSGADGNSAGANVVIDGNRIELGAGPGTSYAMTLSEIDTTYASISNNTRIGGAGWHEGRASLAAFEAYYDALPGTVCAGNLELVE